ncbi:predicted protein [Lichtheimia corymbifera JMRC:FSU:9682]|uniref:Uncharacterized protein n=1 Tax=Lichtheimia corymbifera JMRC:FSU:9682 TaxID=1263082 RepID=A0A068SCV6_9FUNG|nr:predicted protein [Lichtheimia corymbifera JMRC:FSU:9682]
MRPNIMIVVPRNFRIQQRAFIHPRNVTAISYNTTIPTMRRRFYATADRSNEKNKSDKETKEYLEKMMDEEEASQQSSEHVDPEYWNDPGKHANPHDKEGKQPTPVFDKDEKKSKKK